MQSNFLSIVRNLTLLFLILLIVRGGELIRAIKVKTNKVKKLHVAYFGVNEASTY